MAKPKLSFKEQMQGFPWSQILVIACVRFAEPIAFTSLFPYVYFMVKDFGVTADEADVGKYSGYLSSCFALGQVISSMQWGKFADKNGRKPTILIGLTGSICSLLILGFSKNYYMALMARSLMGLLNGNVAVVRTMIGEVTTQRKHQALAFSTMPLVFQIGAVIGPLIGGYLSGGETRFKFLQPLVTKFHYALPNMFISLLLFTSMLIAIFFLEETHSVHKYRHDYFVDLGDLFMKHILKIEPPKRLWNNNQKRNRVEAPAAIDEETALINNDDQSTVYSEDAIVDAEDNIARPLPKSNSDESIQSVGHLLSRRQSVALIRTYSLHEQADEEKVNYRALLTPHIFYAVVCNFIMSLHGIVHDEFLPVFLAYDVAKTSTGELISKFPFKLVGGLGFSSQDTGQLLSSTGILGIFFVLVVFPYVDRHYDCLTTYKRFIKIFPLLYFIIPFEVFLAKYPKFTAKSFIYLMTCLKTLGQSIAFPQILLIVHNSSDPKHRALINGAAISVSALARFTGPLIWGYIMTWGQKFEIGWLTWWSLSLISLLAIYQSRFLRDAAQEEEEEEEEE